MKILLLGADGQVGWELRGPLSTFADVVPLDRPDLDVAEPAELRAVLDRHAPDVIVNTVAYNEVDKAETDRTTAVRLNGEAVAIMGEEAKRRRIGLVTYSTDFVFDGETDRPYREDDPVSPLGAYGESKVHGERALRELDAPAIVFRTAWVWSLRKKSFVSTILKLARERETMKVVDDQIGNPTFARDLAVATALFLFQGQKDLHGACHEARGIYHLAGANPVSRHALAVAAIESHPERASFAVKTIEPVPATTFPMPAKRPRNGSLDCTKAKERLGLELPDFRDALIRAFAGS